MGGQWVFAEPDVWWGPLRLTDPASGPLRVGGVWRYRVLHPGPQHRFGHDTVVDVFEPVVPPSHQFLQESDRRAGLTEVWILVCPWTDQSFAGYLQVLQEPEHRVGVPVGPTTDCQHRTGDRRIVFTDGGVCPVIVPALMQQPLLQPQT